MYGLCIWMFCVFTSTKATVCIHYVRLCGRLFEFEHTSSLQHTLFVNEKLLFSYWSTLHHSNRPKTSHLNILKTLIFPSTHQVPATITVSASSKYSRTVMYYRVWFHPALNIHILFPTVEEKKSKFVCRTHDSHCMCLSVFVCWSKETDISAAVMETCDSIISLLKTTGSSMQ